MAALMNFFVLPTNLIACLLVREPTAPSAALVVLVKAKLAETILPQLQAAGYVPGSSVSGGESA